MSGAGGLVGGCQCGAVRYRVAGASISADVCHCRMCQRAVGGPYAAAFFVDARAVSWTAGPARSWRSSNLAERGFCGDCGTPLYFRYVERTDIGLMIASLDDPNAVRPTAQYCVESKLVWTDDVHTLPGRRLDTALAPDGSMPVENRQFQPGGR